jgi:TetR/AcrR family transcriptional regulator
MSKRVRDGESTRAKILETAERLFAKGGFSGTTIEEISRVSGISDGLILYHYKTKDNLYSAVRERVANRYALSLRESIESQQGNGEMMYGTLRTAFNYFKENRTYHRISLWSYLEGKMDVVENEEALTVNMVELLQRAQNEGLLERDFSPIVLLTVAIGSIHYWLRYRDQFVKILRLNESSDLLDKRFIEQLMELIIRGVVKGGDHEHV